MVNVEQMDIVVRDHPLGQAPGGLPQGVVVVSGVAGRPNPWSFKTVM
ncbi:MAG: hypothetical protein ACOZF2_06430 [Thermodesulfobacteriota bacterium]